MRSQTQTNIHVNYHNANATTDAKNGQLQLPLRLHFTHVNRDNANIFPFLQLCLDLPHVRTSATESQMQTRTSEASLHCRLGKPPQMRMCMVFPATVFAFVLLKNIACVSAFIGVCVELMNQPEFKFRFLFFLAFTFVFS